MATDNEVGYRGLPARLVEAKTHSRHCVLFSLATQYGVELPEWSGTVDQTMSLIVDIQVKSAIACPQRTLVNLSQEPFIAEYRKTRPTKLVITMKIDEMRS